MDQWRAAGLTLLLAVLVSTGIMVVRRTRSLEYDEPLVVLSSELGKLGVALVMLFREPAAAAQLKSVLSLSTLPYVVPAALYAIQNNLQLVTLKLISPAVFQTLNQLKIVVTALLRLAVLGRVLSPGKWLSLVLLVCGSFVVQYSCDFNLVPGAAANADSPMQHSNLVTGVILSLLMCVTSAGSSVFLEWLLQREPESSLHLQNVKLYAFGVALNSAAALQSSARIFAHPVDHLGGLTQPGVLLIVVVNVLTGLMVSVVVKQLNSIYKSISVTVAIVLVALTAAALFGDELTLLMLDGAVVTGIGVLGFNLLA